MLRSCPEGSLEASIAADRPDANQGQDARIELQVTRGGSRVELEGLRRGQFGVARNGGQRDASTCPIQLQVAADRPVALVAGQAGRVYVGADGVDLDPRPARQLDLEVD